MSRDPDPLEELDTLRLRLKQTQDKVANWFGRELNSSLDNLRGQHEKQTKATIDKKRELEGILFEKEKENVQTSKALEKKISELEQMKCRLDESRINSEQLRHQLMDRQADVDKQKGALAQKQQEFEKLTKARQKLDYLNKASGMYERMLGLSLKKAKGNLMQVVFTQIDEKDPQSPFYLFLQIEPGTRKYVVSNPEPPINGLEELAAELNRTNNLRYFMIQVRQKFKDTLDKDAANMES